MSVAGQARVMVVLVLVASPLHAQANTPGARPVPPPMVTSPLFARAIARGTRTPTGRPGAKYRLPEVRYRIDAMLDTARHEVRGSETVTYRNTSSDTLGSLYLHLYQNLYSPGAVRNTVVPVGAGMRIENVQLDRRPIGVISADSAGGYELYSTSMRVTPWKPIMPGDSVEVSLAFAFEVLRGAMRSGRSSDGELYMVAYWYPQIAVFDDVSRWHADLYAGTAEFNNEFADYDVTLRVPENWVVMATGVQTNADSVLSDSVLARLRRARRSEQVTSIVRDGERAVRAGATQWKFTARGVRDVAWAASPRWVWDAAAAWQHGLPGEGPDTVLVSAVYRPTQPLWRAASGWTSAGLRGTAHHLNTRYPYASFTSIQGPGSCSGMEYPMLTCVDQRRDSASLRSVLVHEVSHSWAPMLVGSDEKRYPWMDEGLTRYEQDEVLERTFGDARWREARDAYLRQVSAQTEAEIMRNGDLASPDNGAYQTAAYFKPALVLRALRGVVGDSLLLRAQREFVRRWVGKHPMPDDFFNTFNDVVQRDLGWFWRTWFYETWPLDQAIAHVRRAGDALELTVEDRGWAPMPVLLSITRDDGSVERRTLPVEPWLAGQRTQVLRLSHGARVTRVIIDVDELFPDTDRTNQEWRAARRR